MRETAIKGVYLNAGNGPMGWSTACDSAELVADVVMDREPAIDVGPYAPER